MISVGSEDTGRRGSPARAEGPVAWGVLCGGCRAHLLGPHLAPSTGVASLPTTCGLTCLGSALGPGEAEPATPSQKGPHPHPHHGLLQRTTPQQPGASSLHAWMAGRARGLTCPRTHRAPRLHVAPLGRPGPDLTDLDGELVCANLALCTAPRRRAWVCGKAQVSPQTRVSEVSSFHLSTSHLTSRRLFSF